MSVFYIPMLKHQENEELKSKLEHVSNCLEHEKKTKEIHDTIRMYQLWRIHILVRSHNNSTLLEQVEKILDLDFESV